MRKRNIISTLMKNTISSVLIVCMSLGLFNVVPLQANENDVICGLEEHVHTDECFNEQNPCQKQVHTHSEECYKKTEETPKLPVEENEPVTNEEPKETENVQIENNKQETEVTIPEQEEVNDTPAEPSDNNVGIAMEGDFEGSENNALHWKLDASDKYGFLLVISGKGPMKDYDASSNAPWNEAISSKTGNIAIKIEEGITRIGNHAFESDCFGENVEIAKTVSYIGESAFSKNATKVVFSGINDYVEIKPSAFNQVLKNIEDGKTKFHVDNQGIVYQLNDGETAKVVYASYSDKQSVIIPDHVASCGKIYRINSIGKEAFNQLENLKEVTFDKPEQIVKLEDNAFANRFLLNKINGKSNINEIIELFDKNVYQGKDVFLNTSLVQKKIVENKDVKFVGPTLSYGSDETGTLTINSFSEKWENGAYKYLTGESHDYNLSFELTSIGANQTYRIYFLRSNEHINIGFTQGNHTIVTDSGNQYTLSCKQDPNNPLLMYLELEKGTTEDTFIIERVASSLSPESPKGELKIWAEIFETEKGQSLPTEVPSDDKCMNIEWNLMENQFTLMQYIGDLRVNSSGDESGDGLVLSENPSFNISSFVDTDSSNNFGANPVETVTYKSVLKLSEGISWKPEMLNALDKNDVRIDDQDATRQLIIGGKPAFIFGNVENNGRTLLSIDIKKIDDKTLEFIWKIKRATNAQLKENTTNLTLIKSMLDIDRDILLNPDSKITITNDLSTVTEYKHNGLKEVDRISSTAKLIPSPAELSMTMTSGPVRDFGEKNKILITLENKGVGTYTKEDPDGFSLNVKLDDDNLYMKTDDMVELFKSYEDMVSVTLNKIEEKEFIEVKDVKGGKAYKNSYNSNVDGSTNQTVKVSFKDDEYVVLFKEIEYRYDDLEQAFRELGIVPTRHTNVVVDFIFKATTFQLLGGEKKEFTVPVTTKDTFTMIGEDLPTAYIDGDGVYYYNDCVLKGNSIGRLSGANQRNGYASYEAVIDQVVYKNGNSAYIEDVGVGDEVDYELLFSHSGSGTYENLPLVDELFGNQYALAPYEENKDNSDLHGLDIYTGKDGVKYYKLNKEGNYHNVLIGMDQGDGNILYNAHTITVKQGDLNIELPDAGNEELETNHKFSGYHTKIEWMYGKLEGFGYTKYVRFKALVDFGASSGTTYELGNIGWANDRVDRRIFTQLYHGGTIFDFDKEIVDVSGGLENPTVDPDDRSVINNGDSVTYRLTIENKENFPASISGDKFADKLPDNGRIFKWTKDNIKIEAIATDSQISFDGLDEKWDIKDTYGNHEAVSGRTQFICWDDDVKVQFPKKGKVYIFVTLTFPSGEQWIEYRDIVAGTTLKNTFIFLDFTKSVTHTILPAPKVRLQKGVYSVITHQDESQHNIHSVDRVSFAPNDYSSKKYVTYYAFLYNSSDTKLYINTIEDILPKGFTFDRLVDQPQNIYDNSNMEWDKTASSPTSFISYSSSLNIKFKNAIVDVDESDPSKIKFDLKAYDDKWGTSIQYDEKEGKCFLGKNEAVLIAYMCEVGSQVMVEEKATNMIGMPVYDPDNMGFKPYTGTLFSGSKNNFMKPFVNYNDGGMSIYNSTTAKKWGFSVENDQNWLFSSVAVNKYEILPSVTKSTENGMLFKSEDTIDWRVEYKNEGQAIIDDYVIYDVLPYPHRTSGDINYQVGNEIYSLMNISSIDIDKKQVRLQDTKGYTGPITIYDNKEEAKLTDLGDGGKFCFYTEGENVVLKLHCEDAQRAIKPGQSGILTYSSRAPSGMLYNKTLVNEAGIIPRQSFSGTPSDGLIKEVDGQKAVYNYAIAYVTMGAYATSDKEVYEIENDNGLKDSNENNEASTNNMSVISLSDKNAKFRYTLNVLNDKERNMEFLTMIDTLPYEGDTAPFDPSFARNSEFNVGFDEDPKPKVFVSGKALPENEYKLQYSSAVEFNDSDWKGENSEKWTDTPTDDSKSIRVVLDYRDESKNPIPPNATVQVSFNAVVDDDNVEPSQVAWNTFGYRCKFDAFPTYLDANPLFVGVKTPSAPILQKKLVDLDGNPHVLTQEEVGEDKNSATFDLIIHKGNALSNYPEDLKHKEITKIQTKVNVGQSESDKQKIYDTKTLRWNTNTNDWEETRELWKWEHGQTYTVLEEDVLLDDYEFYQFEGNPGKTTYTFTYDRAKDERINLVNMFNRWDIKVVKQDSKNDDIKLNGAVFGLYTSDKKDKIESSEYEEEFTIDGTTWYLKDVQTTDNKGEILWKDLTNDAYYVVELKAPDGYKFPKENKHLVTKTKKEVQVHIDNESGFLIPGTGGSGTNMFVVSGLVIAGIALLLLERKKKRLKGG